MTVKVLYQLLSVFIVCLAGVSISALASVHTEKTLSDLILANQAKLEANQNNIISRLESIFKKNDNETLEDLRLENFTDQYVHENVTDASKEPEATDISALIKEIINEKLKDSISSSLKDIISKMRYESIDPSFPHIISPSNNTAYNVSATEMEADVTQDANIKMEPMKVSTEAIDMKTRAGDLNQQQQYNQQQHQQQYNQQQYNQQQYNQQQYNQQQYNQQQQQQYQQYQQQYQQYNQQQQQYQKHLKGFNMNTHSNPVFIAHEPLADNQLFLIYNNGIYQLHKYGTLATSQGGLQYMTGKDIRSIITGCKYASLKWVDDLVKSTNYVYKFLVITSSADARLKRSIIQTEAKLLNTFSKCDSLIGKQPVRVLSRNTSFKFPQTSKSTLSGYQNCSLNSIKKKQIKRIGMLTFINNFMKNVNSYNHLKICSPSGFDIARAALLNILTIYRQIIESDIKKLEIALVRHR